MAYVFAVWPIDLASTIKVNRGARMSLRRTAALASRAQGPVLPQKHIYNKDITLEWYGRHTEIRERKKCG